MMNVTSAEETAAPLLKARGHTLTRCHPPGPVLVAADHVRLAQVFANLINNAAKYTPPGGQVLVSVEIGVDVVIVHVKDNGIGISPEMQSAVFELFFQADQSIERGNSGLGLGLTLTRQLVELHGGSIEVHSEGLGQGATFSVTLPLSQPGLGEAPPMEQVTDDTAEGPTEGAPIHILIADDNHDFVTSLSTLLMSRGHRVSCAHSGRQAFDLAREQPPDLVLLDIGMPELNGYELAARLTSGPARHGDLIEGA